MIKKLAMHYKKYSKVSYYDLLKKKAKSDKIGMWSHSDVTELWK